MSGSDHPSITWPSLIKDLTSRWGPEWDAFTCGCGRTFGEREIRQEIIHLCNEHKYRDEQRLLNRIHRQYGHINEFTTAIDEANQLHPPDSLRALLGRLLAKTVQAAFHAGKKPTDLLLETGKLNSEVPAFNRETLKTFQYDLEVQRPLYALFTEYVDCYLSMFDFATSPPALSLPQFELRVRGTGSILSQCYNDWTTALKEAEAEKQRQIQSATVTSSPSGVFGDLNDPHATFTHFLPVPGEPLGEGSYGKVTVVKEASTGELFAQKLIRIQHRHDPRAREVLEQQVMTEVNIMKKLRHHHIAVVLLYVRHHSAFSLIMLPIADYDLRWFLEHVCVADDFPSKEIKHLDNWFGCLISALAYAHEERIRHEDIKPSNILIKDHRPYLADFGSAKDFSALETSTTPGDQLAGTPVYWPPETARGRSADIFALGCVFSEMLTVRQKQSLSDYRDARHVQNTDFGYSFRKNLKRVRHWVHDLPEVDKEVPSLIQSVILNMIKENPDDRDNAKKIKRMFRAEEEMLFCSVCC